MTSSIGSTRASAADLPIERVSTSHTGFRLSWGAVFAGLAIATALQIVLTLFGVGFGLGAYSPGGEKALGIGAGLWAIVSLLIALFVGGTTTGRLAGRLTRVDGFLHGVLLWALSTLLTLYLITSGLGTVLGGAFTLFGKVAGTAASAAATGVASATGAGVSAAAGALSNPNNDAAIQSEIEQSLRQTGDPSLRPDSLKATAKQAGNVATNGPADNGAAASDIVNLVKDRARNIDRNDIVNIIAAKTGKSRAESEQMADRVTQAATDARSKLSQTAQDVKATVQEKAPEIANKAASISSTTIWLALLGMGLSLAAAVFGTQRTAPE